MSQQDSTPTPGRLSPATAEAAGMLPTTYEASVAGPCGWHLDIAGNLNMRAAVCRALADSHGSVDAQAYALCAVMAEPHTFRLVCLGLWGEDAVWEFNTDTYSSNHSTSVPGLHGVTDIPGALIAIAEHLAAKAAP